MGSFFSNNSKFEASLQLLKQLTGWVGANLKRERFNNTSEIHFWCIGCFSLSANLSIFAKNLFLWCFVILSLHRVLHKVLQINGRATIMPIIFKNYQKLFSSDVKLGFLKNMNYRVSSNGRMRWFSKSFLHLVSPMLNAICGCRWKIFIFQPHCHQRINYPQKI